MHKGVDVNMGDEMDLTPVHHAAIAGSDTLLKSLLSSNVHLILLFVWLYFIYFLYLGKSR